MPGLGLSPQLRDGFEYVAITVRATCRELTAMRIQRQRAAGKDGIALRIAGLMDRYGLTSEAEMTLRAALERKDEPELRQMLASLLHKSGRKEAALVEWNRLAAGASLPQVQQTARLMQAHGFKLTDQETELIVDHLYAVRRGIEKTPG